MPISHKETRRQFVARLSGVRLNQLDEAIMALPSRPRQALVCRFGLRRGRRHGHFRTLDEVAGALRISRDWARRLINMAMRLMRKHCAAPSLARAS